MRIIHDPTKIREIMEDQNNAASWSRNRLCVKVSRIRLSLVSISKVSPRMRGGGVDLIPIFVYEYLLQPGDVATPNCLHITPPYLQNARSYRELESM